MPDSASQTSPAAETSQPERSPEAARDAARRMYGPPRAWALVFLSPSPLLTYGVPVIFAAVVATVVGLTIVPNEAVVIVNGNLTQLTSSTAGLVAAVVAAVLLCAGHAFGITAATHSLIANTTDSSLPARAAWGRAARRPGLVVLAFVGALALFVAAVAASVALAIAPLWAIGGLVLALIVLIVVAPLLLAWPQLVLRSASWGQALARGWRSGKVVVSGRAEDRTPRVNLIITTVVVGGLGVGLRLLAGLMPQSLLSAMVAVALGIVVPAVFVLVLSAVAVRAVVVREESRVRIATQPIVPMSAPSWAEKESDAGTRGGALVGLAVLLVPALLAAPLALVNPWGFASYSAVTMPTIEDSASIVPVGDDGTAVLSANVGYDRFSMRLCKGASCSPISTLSSYLSTDTVETDDGGLLTAQWMFVGDEEDTADNRFELDAVSTSADELRRWDDTNRSGGPSSSIPPGDRTTVATLDSTFSEDDEADARTVTDRSAVAVSNDGEYPVIAAVARRTGGPPEATMWIVFCDDDACSSATTKTTQLEWIGGSPSSASIDLVVTEDGTAVVTLADREDSRSPEPIPALRVFSAKADGAEFRVEAPLLADITETDEARYSGYDETFGARIELGADGLPVLLSRPEGSSELRLISCADASCASAGTRDLTGFDSWSRTPAFAIDESGRPLIAVADKRRASLDLIDCLDAACSDLESRSIAKLALDDDLSSTEALALSLDSRGNPIIAVGDRLAGDVRTDVDTFDYEPGEARPPRNDQRWAGTVLNCSDARCGLK
ncbi:hypothetical protein ITJ38_14575 [Agreia pratensis]|uniref:hypothetical protein n=1 Tax=Agreia pratensis TaxID=150121 RepID=UPI00188A2A3F|nr:hypothetical protein [Agreia pratensis]MBF4635635.1 hypothetical protein [Agreia pratensis]